MDYLEALISAANPQGGARQPSGFAPLDALLGGITPGETIGLLGPMKGGKTTFGYSVITDYLQSPSPSGGERRATLVSYEDSRARQWQCLLLSYLRDVERDQVVGFGLAELPADLQRRLRAADRHLNSALTFVDRAAARQGGSGGVKELENDLRELHAAGQLGEIVVLDHAYALAGYASGANGSDALRDELRLLCWKFPQLMAELGTVGLLIHQLNAAGNRLQCSQQPKLTDAAEHQHFAQFLHHCVCLGTRDVNGVGWLSLACSRPIEAGEAVAVRLAGERCRVELIANAEFSPRLGRFIGGDLPPALLPARSAADWRDADLSGPSPHERRFERRR